MVEVISSTFLSLYKPHPGKILKTYAIKEVIEHLKEKGKIEHE